MAIILKANKVNLFVSSFLFVFWYHSPKFLDTPRKNHVGNEDYYDYSRGFSSSNGSGTGHEALYPASYLIMMVVNVQ
jgi:hypothetical protein